MNTISAAASNECVSTVPPFLTVLIFSKGQDGAPGLPGATGAAGLRGPKGLPGHIGEKGIRGQTGEKGIAGQDGEDVSAGKCQSYFTTSSSFTVITNNY